MHVSALVLLSGIAAYIVYRLLVSVALNQQRKKFVQKTGCLPAPDLPHKWFDWLQILPTLELVAENKKHQLLALLTRRFENLSQQHGRRVKTYELYVFKWLIIMPAHYIMRQAR